MSCVINFGSYKGYYNYGESKDRNSIDYRPTISPRKINFLIDKSLTKDIGFQESFEHLSTDGNNIFEAITGLNNITRSFLGVAQERGTEISKENPPWSKTPIIGILPTIFRDDFNNDIKRKLVDVKEDWSNIKKHYQVQVEKINNHFMESCEETSKQSKKGMPSYREKYKLAANTLKDGMSNTLKTVKNELIEPTDRIMNDFVPTIYEAVQSNQNGRAVRKGILDALHFIPVIGTLGAEFGKIALDAVGDVATDIAHGNFQDLVHDVVSDFHNININDLIHGVHLSNTLDNVGLDSFSDFAHHSIDFSNISDVSHCDNIFQDFINTKPHECISNIDGFKDSINWGHCRDVLGHSIFTTGVVSTADTLQQNIKKGKIFSIKDFTKAFMINTLISPLSMAGEWLTGFYEDIKVDGIPIRERIEKFVKPIGDAPITPEIIKKRTDALADLLPKITYNLVQENTSPFAAKLLIGKPLSTPDFEKLFKSMDAVLKASNKALSRR